MDLILWAIVAAFIAWELYAHFVARNRSAHTLSNRIHWLERRHGWTRVPVAIACVLLLTHLVFSVP